MRTLINESWLFVSLTLAGIGFASGSLALIVIGAMLFGTGGIARLWSRLSLEQVFYRRTLSERRVFVGTAPWRGGTAQAMMVIGSGSRVDLKINLKRPAKDRLVWIQARDADGNWGPTRSVWLRGS